MLMMSRQLRDVYQNSQVCLKLTKLTIDFHPFSCPDSRVNRTAHERNLNQGCESRQRGHIWGFTCLAALDERFWQNKRDRRVRLIWLATRTNLRHIGSRERRGYTQSGKMMGVL